MVLAAALAAVALPAGATLSAASAADAEAGPEVEPRVLTELSRDDTTTFWVYLEGKAELDDAARITDRARQGEVVRDELQETAKASQAGLIEVLDEAGADYQPFWIANAVEVTGDADLLDRITSLPEVDQVTADRTYTLPEPTPAGEIAATGDVEWGIDRIGAPKVWDEFDADGEGIVVGSIDSGVQYNHPALVEQYRGNNGDGTFSHDYSWWDPGVSCGIINTVPCDNVGHGTHTVGTMVGDDGGDNHIGVAPGATWIAAKGCSGSTCNQSMLLSSGEFMLAPTTRGGRNPRPDLRPDVINNSWGSAAAGEDPWFKQTVDAWVAAGIFPVFSNGNEGPTCGSDGNPGNMEASYGVGAFDADGNIASFSSRGPSQWDDDLIKPDVSAPGVAIRSSYPGSKYAVGSGTSMAAPHVAGSIALLWSAAPAVRRDIDLTRRLLDETAIDVEDLSCGGTAGDNNVWGQGRLDTYAAAAAAPRGETGTVSGTVTDAETGAPVANATISVNASSGPVGLPATTDAEGRFSALVSTGSYTVTASATAYVDGSQPAAVGTGETTTVDLALEAPAGKALALSDDALDFGSVPIGTTADAETITLTNTGGVPVTVFDVTDHANGFVHEGGTCSGVPFQLSRLETCTLEISFRPTEQGPSQTSLAIASSADPDQRISVQGAGTPIPARVGSLQTASLQKYLQSAVIDPAGRYAYFGTANLGEPLPGVIVKYDLKTFKRVGTISVGIGQKMLQTGVMDPSGKYAYFGIATSPARVVRIDLDTFKMDKILMLAADEYNIRSSIIDPDGRYAYFGTGTNPGKVVKVDLATFTRVGAAVVTGEYLATGVIDPAGEFGYFGTMNYPEARVVKVDLDTMAQVGSITLGSGERYLRSSVMDPAGRYAYFGSGEASAGKLVRVDLAEFKRDTAIDVAVGLTSGVIDPSGRFATFGTVDTPGRVFNIDLDTFEKSGSVTLGKGEDGLVSAIIDPKGEHVYFGTRTGPGKVVKVRVGAPYRLSAEAHETRTGFAADLAWHGATAPQVDVVRGGVVVATVPNTGRYTDEIVDRSTSSSEYRICDTGTDRCSNPVTAEVTPAD
ncbi:hypothetical protein GCM10007979_03630 [Nocardioides albus]|nr:hypothetical protein GCM10007979_03630 [Nocardioides albus]